MYTVSVSHDLHRPGSGRRAAPSAEAWAPDTPCRAVRAWLGGCINKRDYALKNPLDPPSFEDVQQCF
jgi:hypothetical protein